MHGAAELPVTLKFNKGKQGGAIAPFSHFRGDDYGFSEFSGSNRGASGEHLLAVLRELVSVNRLPCAEKQGSSMAVRA